MTIRNRRNSVSRSLDYGLLLIYLSLLAIGWVTLRASVFQEGSTGVSFFDFDTAIGKHTLWIAVALVIFVFTLVIDWQLWNTFAYPIYAVTVILLIAVLLFGADIKGARSWFSFGGFSIQPSEFAKFGTALALSSYLSHFSIDLRHRQPIMTSLAIIGLPMILIVLQPDAGSALVFLSFFILFYIKGLDRNYYLYGGGLALIFILSLMFTPLQVLIGTALLTLLAQLREQLDWRYISAIAVILVVGWYLSSREDWLLTFGGIILVANLVVGLLQILAGRPRLAVLSGIGLTLCALLAYGSSIAFHNLLQPHQQDRINVWLRPDKCDRHGSLYNIIQSKLAIGSGGWTGKGHLNGTMTKLNYVPEQSTDFIFSIIGEEQGFAGALVVISLYLALLIKVVQIAERAKTPFIRCYGYAVAGLFFVHFFVNIGMSVGLMPIIGIPLPFLSKGGSALIGFTVLIGVLLRMDLARHRS